MVGKAKVQEATLRMRIKREFARAGEKFRWSRSVGERERYGSWFALDAATGVVTRHAEGRDDSVADVALKFHQVRPYERAS